MIEAGPETLSPPLIEMRDAFFGWKERGFQNAWESLNAVADARVGAEHEKRVKKEEML